MKFYITLVFLVLSVTMSAAQVGETVGGEQLLNVVAPQYPGGEVAKKKFISSEIKYLKKAKEEKVEGVVELKFIVESNGQLTNFEVVQDPGYGLGKEVLRVYQLMPEWIPGGTEGLAQRVPVSETINFKLREQEKQVAPPIDRKTLRKMRFRIP